MDNQTIARKLTEYANHLEARESNVYRVRAYRQAAQTVLRLDRQVRDIVAREGRAGLEALPGIGKHLSYTLEGLVRTGEFRTLGGDGGSMDPQRLLLSLPGVGPQLATTLHQQLGITTLEELERAAHDGRLTKVGVGPKRLRGLIDALAGRLSRARLPEPGRPEPPVSELLAVDEEYRSRAVRNDLPTIAPHRFNPEGASWLPLLTTRRNGWQYRALYSNTAVAHRLNQTHNWVVLYFTNGVVSGQRTIVTEPQGDLRGRRVVRGREQECRDYYVRHQPGPAEVHTTAGDQDSSDEPAARLPSGLVLIQSKTA
jgi:hypothetical protein